MKCFFILLFSNCIFCQVGIGTRYPNINSVLDIDSSSKGVSIPRLNLESTDSVELIINAED
jgi:hypothetical protein